MHVVFRRTGTRRYAIEARRARYPDVGMDPAPGFDPLVPHDLLHMVVEARLGLDRGVFGQLAAGGDAGTFGRDLAPAGRPREAARRKRRIVARGKKLLREGQDEAAQSERASYLCWYEWLARSSIPARRRLAQTMAEQARQVRDTSPPDELRALGEEVLERICEHLDLISERWSRLEVGEGIEVSWPDLALDGAPAR